MVCKLLCPEIELRGRFGVYEGMNALNVGVMARNGTAIPNPGQIGTMAHVWRKFDLRLNSTEYANPMNAMHAINPMNPFGPHLMWQMH